MRMQVWSLALLSELRIRRCHELWYRSQMRLGSHVAVAVALTGSSSCDSTPRLGTSICRKCGPKKTKDGGKKKRERDTNLHPVNWQKLRSLAISGAEEDKTVRWWEYQSVTTALDHSLALYCKVDILADPHSSREYKLRATPAGIHGRRKICKRMSIIAMVIVARNVKAWSSHCGPVENQPN